MDVEASPEAVGAPEASRGTEGPAEGPRRSPFGRLASFRFTYLAIFVFLVAYVTSIEALEALLTRHFQAEVAQAVAVDATKGPVPDQIATRIDAVRESPWIRWGRVRVRPIVLAADGYTLLYAGGLAPLPPKLEANGVQYLPARADVDVSVPHNALAANAILVLYSALLVSTLFAYTRRLARQEQEALRAVQDERAALATRASSIEGELATVRRRLAETVPERQSYAEEIAALQSERQRLLSQVEEVEERELSLLEEHEGASDLHEEHQALEALLEEATQDLDAKDEEIRQLQKQVKRIGRGQSKEAEVLGRRLRTLYKNLEVDDHAIDGLLALGDESLKLRAEEALKRLSDDPESAGVRRKVGGLPMNLTIFEQGFAGKGRLYTTKGRKRRFRLLAVGAKNSQKTDLEYLSRLPKDG